MVWFSVGMWIVFVKVEVGFSKSLIGFGPNDEFAGDIPEFFKVQRTAKGFTVL
jgi:hypothetical protein